MSARGGAGNRGLLRCDASSRGTFSLGDSEAQETPWRGHKTYGTIEMCQIIAPETSRNGHLDEVRCGSVSHVRVHECGILYLSTCACVGQPFVPTVTASMCDLPHTHAHTHTHTILLTSIVWYCIVVYFVKEYIVVNLLEHRWLVCLA